MTNVAEPTPAHVPYHLKPIDGPPPADIVAGADNSIMAGLVLEYRYSSGREYRLTFAVDQVTFEMLDSPAYKPEYAIPVSLPYYARPLREEQVLIHWMVPNRIGHVALVIDFAANSIYASALMPFKMEMFDVAEISSVTRKFD
ncbi:hypothetical protein [Sphingomonas sp.]|jgi:hypothetical protein|uniref:hypothetical protein n=1 Tax=Sphingomonas sp. TaxID=28214 RepID=UPI002D7F19F3|nr:hypothetical protein [Sphingomonas sp.]HEU0044482.1 hypothetical protein [Sphingomonas sp.]